MRRDLHTDHGHRNRYWQFWRNNVQADVAAEMRFHLECAIEEYVAAGNSSDEARAGFATVWGRACDYENA